MRKASTELLEQGTQTPSPAPDLIPAETNINRELTLRLVQQTGALQGHKEIQSRYPLHLLLVRSLLHRECNTV